MSSNRVSVLLSILRGLLLAVALTLSGMLVIAALALFARISDGLLTTLNQLLKVFSIVFGVCYAVGRGGRRGFVTGAVLSLIYTILGYALYLILGGATFSASQMLGEILLGATIGSLTGAILANLQPRRRRARTA